MNGLSARDLTAVLGVPYTPEQLAVITAPPDAPLLVVAGAGSGKTTVMAARVVWLVGNGQVRPEQVLGLTFTNKAAASLAAKIRDALARLAGTADLDDALEPTVSTYHAYAGRLVREHGLRIGIEPEARILADATRFQLAHRIMRRYDRPLPSLRWVPDTVVGKLVALEGACSDHLVDPRGLAVRERERVPYLQTLIDELAGVPKSKTRRDDLQFCLDIARARAELCDLVLAYRSEKREMDVADFGDQIAAAVRIAQEAPEAVATERERFQAVFLDEYQDTSVAQSRLLSGLFADGRGVTAVGDPCQAIYGWRGASVSNLLSFPTDFPDRTGTAAAVRSLRTSQRSGGRLLQLANALSLPIRERSSVVELVSRTDRIDVGEVIVARHERYDEERAWVAQQVRAEIDAGTAPAEIAVLLRAWRHAAPLHQALTDAGVPVEVVGLGGLLALPEVADVIATLELVDEPAANAALLRLLTGPRWMFGAQDLRALGSAAGRLAQSSTPMPEGGEEPYVDPLDEAAAGVDPTEVVAIADALDAVAHGQRVPGLSDEGRTRARLFARELATLRRAAGEPLPELISRVITAIGLDVEAAASPDAVAARRRASLAALADIAASYVDLDGRADLHGFLGYLRAAEDYDRGFDNPLEVSGDAVQILTIHKAKGLEWDVVVLPDLTNDVFPAKIKDSRWPRNIGELPYGERQDAASLPADPDFAEPKWKADFDARCKDHEKVEEDRLAYVAVTRARRTVIASNAVWGPTQVSLRPASPYLEALRDHALAGHGRVEVWHDDPPRGERNPYLELAPVPWPPPLAADALARRREAARLVARGADGTDPIDARDVTAAERRRFAEYDREIEVLLAEAHAARVSVVDVPLPAALSASQVMRLRADPDGLAEDLARPMPRRPARAAARGTAFHAWVEEQFALTPLLDDDALLGAADDELADADLAELKAAFLASSWSGRQPAAVEVTFHVVLGGRVIRGRIDAVYAVPAGEPDGARWHVVDWKTGREDADPLQLAVYRTAWARMNGCSDAEVRASFWNVRHDELSTPALVSADELDALIAGM
jgi:DNA helicase-2/ATP-dependent DNA helicase PcrA